MKLAYIAIFYAGGFTTSRSLVQRKSISDLGRMDLESALKGCTDLHGVEKGSVTYLDKRNPSILLPLTERPEAGAGSFRWEYSSDAFFGGQQDIGVGHEQSDACKCGFRQMCASACSRELQKIGRFSPAFRFSGL